MKLIKTLTLVTLIIFQGIILAGCNHSVLDDLKPNERKIAEKIIAQIKRSQDTISLNDNNSYIKYLEYVSAYPLFEPIDSATANNLINNYELKGQMIEKGLPNSLRKIKGKSLDTRRIWIPTDQLYPFITQLINLETTDHKLTGVDIYLSSYLYNEKLDTMTIPGPNGRIRRNSDSLSGRTTLVFIGTEDTSNTTNFNVLSQKEVKNISTSFGLNLLTNGATYYNHGSLCPDSCAIK